MGTKILITGGSGMIGKALSAVLTKKGFEIAHLSRNPKAGGEYPMYLWDLHEKYIDPKALDTDLIIHLAGEGIADKRWTPERKDVLQASRIQSAQLLYNAISKRQKKPLRIISASAIGYYGSDTKASVCKETTLPGDDFIGQFVLNWERQLSAFDTLGMQVSLLRIGFVLAKQGGALPKLMRPIFWGVGAPIGSGLQQISWIHIDDLCQMFVYVIEHQLSGIYNAVTDSVTNADLTCAIAKQINRPLWLPNIPNFTLKLLFGEMASLILGGNKVSADKILAQGFEYDYPELEGALAHLFKH